MCRWCPPSRQPRVRQQEQASTVPCGEEVSQWHTVLGTQPFLDVMHRIFYNALFPRIRDKDKVHAYLVDMMLLCEEARRQVTQPLDISHIMWVELRFAVYNHKVPIYGPYLHLFISKTWEKLYPDEDFSAPNWVRHEPIKLH